MRQNILKFAKRLSRQKEVIIAVGIAVALSALTSAIFIKGPKHPPPPPNNAVSITSTVTPASNEEIATKGEVLNWQKSVRATEDTTNIDGTIIEAIDENQTFDGNLDLPKGWTVQYSCDARTTPDANRTYATTPACALSGVTFLKLNTGTAQTFKPFSQAPLVQPLEEQALSNGSYKSLLPILYNNKVFQVMQAVNVEDAGSSSDFTMNCFDLTTYATCTDIAFPTYFSTAVGPLGSGAKNIDTPLNMQSFVDDGTYGNKGRMYMPGQSGNSYGVVCVDLQLMTNCGYTSLGTSGSGVPGNDNPVLLSGFIQSGGKLYGHANDADQTNQTVVCYDLNSNGNGLDAPCTGFSATTVASTPTYRMVEHNNAYLTTGNHILDGTRLYWVVNYSFRNSNGGNAFPPAQTQRNYGSVITCFDVSTKTHCSGWPNITGGVLGFYPGAGLYNGAERPSTLFAWRNTDGSMHAACFIIGLGNSADPTMSCFRTSDGVLLNDINGTPGHPGKMFPAQWIFVFWTGSPYVTDITDSDGAKTYIPMWNSTNNSTVANPNKGATFCWNWTTASKCSGFATPRYWHEINNSVNGDTGYVYDGSCMIGVGFGNKIWSFNAKTGESPCRVARTKYTASLTPNDFYCDNATHVFSWGKVRLSKASMYDFESFNVTVKNGAGTTVLEQSNLKSTTELDLSSIPYTGNENLTVEVISTVYNTSPWANSNLPFVNITANADEAQYCYKTVAKDYCDVSGLSTSSDASVVTDIDTITSEKTTTIPLDQPANEQCFKDLKVSVSSDKTQVKNNENLTYSIKVDNKANTDPEGRGNIPSSTNPNTARIEAVLPTGMTYVSSSDGGQLQGNKVVWSNQSINAAQSITRTVTLKAPASATVGFDTLKAKSSVVYAATTQQPLAMQVTVIYGDDVDQADNSTSDNTVIFANETPDAPTTPTTPTTPTEPTGPTPGETPTEQQPENVIVPQGPISSTTEVPVVPRSERELTPGALKSVLPPSLSKPVESIFQAVNAAVAPISPSVAEAIPYGAIGFLIAFTIIYAYQALQEARVRKDVKQLTDRFKRTEATRKNYIDLTSHYLNTPVTTMQSTVELLRGTQQLPQATAAAAQQRLQHLVQHTQLLLGESQALSSESNEALASLNQVKLKPFVFTAGFYLPVAGVLIAAVLANVLFVWAEKYNANILTVGAQASFYILGAVALAAVYNTFRRQKYATSIAEQELKLEQEVAASQTNFITNSGNALQNDVMELDQLAPSITAQPKGKTFASGLSSLKDAISKMVYLNALTTHNAVPTIANDTLKDLAAEVITSMEAQAKQQQVELVTSIEPGLTAVVDLDGFKQLLSSTLDNAIKFNKPGGKVNLTIGRKDDRTIIITVKDTGSGIAKEKIDQLFTPFARGTDTLEFNYEGFGLDLYMDKLIAEQCGGTIAIDSTEGVGTTVTITLPS